jgi:hypothetical protein
MIASEASIYLEVGASIPAVAAVGEVISLRRFSICVRGIRGYVRVEGNRKVNEVMIAEQRFSFRHRRYSSKDIVRQSPE